MTKKYEYLKAHYAESETFDQYYQRVGHLTPNFPKPVLKQWLFDHFDSTINNFSWLEFEKLSFHEESWETERIINTIVAWNEEAVTSWKKAFYTSPDWRNGPLIPFMYENGTWPVPPLVINNFDGLIFPKQRAITRWLLVEGHHRLAYLRALYENPDWTTTNQHGLWIITVGKSIRKSLVRNQESPGNAYADKIARIRAELKRHPTSDDTEDVVSSKE